MSFSSLALQDLQRVAAGGFGAELVCDAHRSLMGQHVASGGSGPPGVGVIGRALGAPARDR